MNVEHSKRHYEYMSIVPSQVMPRDDSRREEYSNNYFYSLFYSIYEINK